MLFNLKINYQGQIHQVTEKADSIEKAVQIAINNLNLTPIFDGKLTASICKFNNIYTVVLY